MLHAVLPPPAIQASHHLHDQLIIQLAEQARDHVAVLLLLSGAHGEVKCSMTLHMRPSASAGGQRPGFLLHASAASATSHTLQYDATLFVQRPERML
jgi:hypothetical protein